MQRTIKYTSNLTFFTKRKWNSNKQVSINLKPNKVTKTINMKIWTEHTKYTCLLQWFPPLQILCYSYHIIPWRYKFNTHEDIPIMKLTSMMDSWKDCQHTGFYSSQIFSACICEYIAMILTIASLLLLHNFSNNTIYLLWPITEFQGCES